MNILKRIINYFGVETNTKPHIVNLFRARLLYNLSLYFLARKLNLSRLPYKPINLMVEVSTACNFLCQTCERELYKKELGGLPKENVRLENIRKLAPVLPYVYSIYLVSGLGEPFLNPEFWQIHAYLKSFKIKTGYFSNASLLTDELIEKTFMEKVNTITISVDAFDKDKYSYIKKGGDYEKTLKIIDSFSHYKNKFNAGYFSLGLNFIFRRDNYKDILDYLEFAQKIGVNYVHCNTLIVHLEKDKDLSFFNVPEQQQREIFAAAEKKAKDLNIGIRLPEIGIKSPQMCGYLWRCMCVFYDGDVCACPYFRTDRNFYYHVDGDKIIYDKKRVGNTVLGNYLKQNINDIWNGKKARNLRAGQLDESKAVSPCDTCYYKYNVH